MREELERRKVSIQAEFDRLSKVETDAHDEKMRLQGEYRLIEQSLKNEVPEVATPSKRIRKVVENAESN